MIVEKSVVINQPREVVYDYLKFSKNMDHYSVWNRKDQTKRPNIPGQTGQLASYINGIARTKVWGPEHRKSRTSSKVSV